MQKEENEQSEKSDLLAVLNTFVPHHLHVSLTEQDKSVSAKSSIHFKSPAMQQGPSRFASGKFASHDHFNQRAVQVLKQLSSLIWAYMSQ